MKASSFAMLLAALLLAPSAPFALAQHEHEGHVAPAASVTSPARRFEPDAALSEGMGRIHAALNELRHYEMGHMPESIAVEKVGEIQSAIDYLFANCKLPAAADAALHGILVPLLGAVQAFEKDPSDMAAVTRMREAVDDYPRQFDDPAWPLPAHSGAPTDN